MSKLKVAFSCAIVVVLIVGLVSFSACTGLETSDSSSGPSGGSCSTGYCKNNGQCCPGSAPNYTYGGHGYAAGCYPSCPYVGDCGASTQCY